MFFPEVVFGVHREFFASLQDIRKFFVDEFEMLTREFWAEPDNKTRELIHRLIHRFGLHGNYNNGFPGGGQAQYSKIPGSIKDKKKKNKKD